MKQLTIKRITSSPFRPGFLGEGHLASPVVTVGFAESDPFIMLMDDRLDLPGGPPVGGAHPHAGFETVTLIIEGNKDWKTGSMEIMTAGKGVVHTEEISTRTRVHILQLWLVLPPSQRWAEPRLQQIQLEDVPTLKTGNTGIRVYSGESNGLVSPIENQTPFTLVDFQLGKEADAAQQIPAGYRGFMYVLDGSLWVGEREVESGQAAWFEALDEANELSFHTGKGGARFVLYAGQPQLAPIVSHGPFIADSQQDIIRLYSEYRQGQMPHVNDLPSERRTRYLRDGKTISIGEHKLVQ